jgi:hypothetical protein
VFRRFSNGTKRAQVTIVGASLDAGSGGCFTRSLTAAATIERLMRFLTALGCQIEIKIGAGTHKKAGKVVVTDVGRRAA